MPSSMEITTFFMCPVFMSKLLLLHRKCELILFFFLCRCCQRNAMPEMHGQKQMVFNNNIYRTVANAIENEPEKRVLQTDLMHQIANIYLFMTVVNVRNVLVENCDLQFANIKTITGFQNPDLFCFCMQTSKKRLISIQIHFSNGVNSKRAHPSFS